MDGRGGRGRDGEREGKESVPLPRQRLVRTAHPLIQLPKHQRYRPYTQSPAISHQRIQRIHTRIDHVQPVIKTNERQTYLAKNPRIPEAFCLASLRTVEGSRGSDS